MATRNYLWSLGYFAHKLCRITAMAQPVIIRLFPENTALQAALSATLAACETLRVEVEKQKVPGV